MKRFLALATLVGIPLALRAEAGVGWIQLDVAAGEAGRVVTYANFSSFEPVFTEEQRSVLARAPSDRNTAELSASLSETRIFSASVRQVIENPATDSQYWDILFSRFYVNCLDGSLFVSRTERVSRAKGDETDTFILSEHLEVATGPEHWKQALVTHVCDQSPWRRLAVRVNYGGGEPNKAGSYQLTCREWAMQELGLQCDTSTDYDSLRYNASFAMKALPNSLPNRGNVR